MRNDEYRSRLLGVRGWRSLAIGVVISIIFFGAIHHYFAIRDSLQPLTDSDVIEASNSPFLKWEMMDRRQILGTINGARVVADYPCGDVCPDYTSRVIHFEADPGAECEAVSGIEDKTSVSTGVENEMVAICVPQALASEAARAGKIERLPAFKPHFRSRS